MPPYMRNNPRDQYGYSRGVENQPPAAQPIGGPPEENLMDVTLSVGFLRGIIAQESSKHAARSGLYDSGGYKQEGVRAMVTAVVPEKSAIGGGNITSAPLEAAESVGRKKVYTAMFPLKGGKVSSSVTIPGLLKGVQRSSRNTPYGHRTVKPQPIDLLISLVLQNEKIYLGKATILATGEEVRTKQIDLPIDVSRDSIVRTLKKTSIGKRAPSITADRHGDVAPTAFKYDTHRRKYKIETDALLRVFIKALPSNGLARRSRSQQPEESRSKSRSKSRSYGQELKSLPSDVRKSRSHSQQPSDTRSSARGYAEQPMDPHGLRRSSSQTRDSQSSRRSQSRDPNTRSSSRRSSSEVDLSHNNYLGASSAPSQSMRSRSSSRARSSAGIPLTIKPQDSEGYRSKSSQPRRNPYPDSVAPTDSVRTGYTRNEMSARSGPPRQIRTAGDPVSVYGASTYRGSTEPRAMPRRAHSVPRMPSDPQPAQSVRSSSGSQYQNFPSQDSYAGSSYRGQRPRSQAPASVQPYGYAGDNGSIANSSYRRDSGASNYPPSQAPSRAHSVISRSQSQSGAQPGSRSRSGSRSQTRSGSRSQSQSRSISRSQSQSQSRSDPQAHRPRPHPGEVRPY